MTSEHTTEAWEPPGPGSWVCDRSHTSPGPTRLYRRMVSEHTEPTYRETMKRYGGAVGSIDMQFVNGAMYRRIVPLVAADRDNGTVPPKAVLWLMTRLHPEFRRRERRAEEVLANKSFLDEIRTWSTTERYEWIDRNKALQAIDPETLDDEQLAAHLRALDEALIAGWTRHHELHSSDLGPIGDLLAHALTWDLDTSAVMSLLRGSSPATTSPADHGATIADELRHGGVDPATITSVEQIRSVAGASEALDTFLHLYRWRLISDYDIEGLTLGEMPSAVAAIVRAAAGPRRNGPRTSSPPDEIAVDEDTVDESTLNEDTADTTPAHLETLLRSQAGDPALFDELLGSAREAYGVRDDNGPLTWAWPAGLTRRAYLEAANRLAAQDRINTEAHVFELDIDELAAVVDGADTPTAEELVERADHRAWERTLDAPDVLGPPAVEPDLSPLPPSIRRVMGIILAAVTLLDPDEAEEGAETDPQSSGTDLTGLGVGSGRYRGVARVADDAATAIRSLNPGDVLVTAWTAPSFNAVLAIAGGVVVQEGGLLCHAAVMARELEIPAVVGCADALTGIADGDLVEIDPTRGRVTVIETSSA